MGNKIKYGIKNAYYAVKTQSGYDTPVAIPGAVSISLDPQGELYKFYADNIEYFRAAVNNGYEGDLEVALLPDSFYEDVLNNTIDSTDKVMTEIADPGTTEFALGFQFEGDEKASRFWFYNCVATRPEVEGDTKEQNIQVKTEKVKISCTPGADGIVRVRTTEQTTTTVYNGWFSAVYPATAPAVSG